MYKKYISQWGIHWLCSQLFTVTCVYMTVYDGSVSASLIVCIVTHFAVSSQTNSPLLCMSEKCWYQAVPMQGRALVFEKDCDILFFAVYNISYRNELSTQLKPLYYIYLCLLDYKVTMWCMCRKGGKIYILNKPNFLWQAEQHVKMSRMKDKYLQIYYGTFLFNLCSLGWYSTIQWQYSINRGFREWDIF